MLIRTTHTDFADPKYAWSAIDDNTYDGADDACGIIGYGETELEAILDLLEHIKEHSNV